MPFEKSNQPTPTQFLTPREKQMRESAERLNETAEAFIDEEVAEAAPLAVEKAAPLKLNIEKDALPKTQEELEAEAKAADEESKRMQAAMRLRDLKANPLITRYRDAFLLEISGLEQLQREFKIGNHFTAVFETLTASDVEIVKQQATFDVLTGRIASRHPLGMEYQASNYRLSYSLKSLVIQDAQTGKFVVNYERSGERPDKLEFKDLRPTDTEVRKIWLYLSQHVVKTQSLQRIINDWFIQFEMLQNDMLELLNLDPGFFTGESSTTG